MAKRYGIPSILNVAPAQPVDLKRIDGLDYLIVNETEAETISGKSVPDRFEAEKCARYLLGTTGIKKVIITLSKDEAAAGAIAGDSVSNTCRPSPMPAVDTTGAGDAFIGSFAPRFSSQGVEEQAAIRRAKSLRRTFHSKKPAPKNHFRPASSLINSGAQRN